MFSCMDGFLGYNQINILPADQPKTTFICPWGTFAYWKLPFGLKNAGATFHGWIGSNLCLIGLASKYVLISWITILGSILGISS